MYILLYNVKNIPYMKLYSLRIVKEGVQAAGSNATKKHIEEISLCRMFLLEAGKKADRAFNVPPASTRHSVRDAKSDINTMMRDLLEKAAVEEKDRHGSPRQSCQRMD